ncbi:heterokaryon incompatibility protein [Colletotrichum sojae]|uniref:Heterokaryon incompatibility protein n=1 Tax=Colletotrichum sojae TaxID=2175907 RepID=A0A8H6ITQ8_9PEZI|nr:heterokaryon incompatibility protein [Colletotrichum sojae]
MSNFQHDHRLHGQQIRLMRLLPGAWLGKLKAELYVADKSHKYVALSYAWGGTRRANSILLNGGIYPITFNLDRALRAIRREQEPLVLWVDSVCINQGDATEKGHQVGLMHDIFGWATEEDEKLLRNLWESPSNYLPEHNEILCMYSLISALKHVWHINDGYLQDQPEFWVAARRPDRPEFLVNSRRLDQIVERIRLLARSDWWNRIRIIQEACVARNLYLLYGRASIPFHFIPAAVSAIRRLSVLTRISGLSFDWGIPGELERILLYLGDKANSIDALRFRTHSHAYYVTTKSPLLWLLRNSRHRKASEPRDKVFALLRLAQDMTTHEKLFRHGFFAVEADYDATVGALFSQVAHEITRQTGLLWITTCDLLAKSRHDIPSWVPDWSSEIPVPGFNSFRLRIQAEIYCKFNASRAVFRHFDPTRGENPRRVFLQRSEQHHRQLATIDTSMAKWQAIHRLPQLSEKGLQMMGFECGSVSYISEPILSDLSNIADAIFQIIPRDSTLLEAWRARNNGSFLDVVVRVLCSSMRIKHDHPQELLPDERRQAEYWMLLRYLGRNFVGPPDQIEDIVAAQASKRLAAVQSVIWASQSDTPREDRSLSEAIREQIPLFEFSRGPDPKRGPDACEAERDWSEDHSWIEDTLRTIASGFRLFVTRGGSVGLGPESMLHDDNIYIIEGGLMPYVLRGSRMMGTCYVEGIMRAGEGEGGILRTDADNAEGLWMSLRDELMRKLGPRDVEERDLCLS